MTHAKKTGIQPPEPRPTLDTAGLAKLLDCSDRHIENIEKAGKLPAAIRIGSLKRWLRSDIDLWLSNGCPNREAFNALKLNA